MAREQDHVRALISEGMTYFAAGALDQARAVFDQALAIAPDHLAVNYYLGAIADELGDAPAAERHYAAVLAADSASRQAYFQLANALYLQDKKWEALSVLRDAERHFPGDREILFYRGQLASRTLPGWHLPMLADQDRNDAFEAAIKARVKPGDIVLDVGTGSGLLSMMAARAGAEHVYTCECEPVMAQLARQIICLNGLDDKITVLPKHSSDVRVGADMPRPADVLISEIFDRALVGEGALPTISHAWSALLKPGAAAIPQGATLYGALIECPHLQRFHHLETVNGFDLTPINALAHPLSYKDAQLGLEETEDHRVLSAPFAIKTFDFQAMPDLIFRAECPVDIVKSGQADALLLWFDLDLAPGVRFSTGRSKPHNHWRVASQVLLDKAECRAGQPMTLKAQYRHYFDFRVIAGR
ncbi:MAG: 50S ribosomal protein L11 methyltransferase [Alphaproteobacteria bacterium]|nr:50S ribosomal protein L11 methyltransferase [Alphaproteobacteria bacterium]MBF0251210.1 50S ribosomal protein L11 methyltransferase [Alphaproteobacteria bacterium]